MTLMLSSVEATQSAPITGSTTSWLIMTLFTFLKIMLVTLPGLMSQSVRGFTVTMDDWHIEEEKFNKWFGKIFTLWIFCHRSKKTFKIFHLWICQYDQVNASNHWSHCIQVCFGYVFVPEFMCYILEVVVIILALWWCCWCCEFFFVNNAWQ